MGNGSGMVIFVDNRMIMEKGRIMTLEAQMNI